MSSYDVPKSAKDVVVTGEGVDILCYCGRELVTGATLVCVQCGLPPDHCHCEESPNTGAPLEEEANG